MYEQAAQFGDQSSRKCPPNHSQTAPTASNRSRCYTAASWRSTRTQGFCRLSSTRLKGRKAGSTLLLLTAMCSDTRAGLMWHIAVLKSDTGSPDPTEFMTQTRASSAFGPPRSQPRATPRWRQSDEATSSQHGKECPISPPPYKASTMVDCDGIARWTMTRTRSGHLTAVPHP